MPGKWGGARRARPPLDPPMHLDLHKTNVNKWTPYWLSWATGFGWHTKTGRALVGSKPGKTVWSEETKHLLAC